MKLRFRSNAIVRGCSVALALVVLSAAFAFGPHIETTFRNKPLKFSRATQPYRAQGTVMVPFRETGALVGAKIALEPDGKRLTIGFGADNLVYEPGHHGYKLNGRHQNMRAASELRKGRLYVPIRLFNDVTTGLVHAEIR